MNLQVSQPQTVSHSSFTQSSTSFTFGSTLPLFMRFDDDQFVFSLQWRGPCHDTRAQSCQKEKFGFGPSSVRNKSAHSYDSLSFEI